MRAILAKKHSQGKPSSIKVTNTAGEFASFGKTYTRKYSELVANRIKWFHYRFAFAELANTR